MQVRFIVILVVCFGFLYGDIREKMGDYISGDAFREIADFVYEDQSYGIKHFIPLSEEIYTADRGKVVFVQTNKLKDFFVKVHPKIKNPYVLITHNSDYTIDSEYARYLNDKKIIHWFAVNVDYVHKKLTPIPIGIENKYYYSKRTKKEDLFQIILNLKVGKTMGVYLNVSTKTFKKERELVVKKFAKKKFVFFGENKSFWHYLLDIKKHTFCFSPSGNGIDCHRTWEAMLLGSIPIVRPFVKKKLAFAKGNTSLYKDLPVIVVHSWDEVTEAFLQKQLQNIQSKQSHLEKLTFSYWENMIYQKTLNE